MFWSCGITLIWLISFLAALCLSEDTNSHQEITHEIHKRLEKIKAFSHLHRHASKIGRDGRDCPMNSFVVITEFPFGQSGNQLIGFTHALWVAEKINSTLVVPEYMQELLNPFHLHGLSAQYCFVNEVIYHHHNSLKKDSIKTWEIESEDAFFLPNILGTGLHAKNYPDGMFPPLDAKLVDEMSMHFLDVFTSLWGHLKPVIVSEALRVLKNKLNSGNLKYTAVHKRSLDGGCNKIFSENFDDTDASMISSQIPLDSADWKASKSTAFCEMSATFVSDVMKLNNREMALKSGDAGEPVFLAWDGQGSIDSYRSANTALILSAEFTAQHDKDEIKKFGLGDSKNLLKFVDLLIAINSDLFVLNPRSTFSFAIHAIRVVLGLQSVPLPPNKDVFMLSTAAYKAKASAGAPGWNGLWVNWDSLAGARKRAVDPLTLIHNGNI